MLSDLFNNSVFPIFFIILVYSVVSAPKFSGKPWANIVKFVLFILAIVYTFNISEQMHSKTFYMKTRTHVTQVESVTKHLEQILDEGKYEQARATLNKFNEGYWNLYEKPAEFKVFINELIESNNQDS